MLEILQLNFGFSDAINYRRKDRKEFFNNIFLRDDTLDKLLESNIFFLLGEKGTGKTAYAVYLSNNVLYKNNISSVRYVQETDYQRFFALKREKHLGISDYNDIWKVILYLLISEQIKETENKGFLSNFSKFRDINDAIDEYYSNAFSPEIICALNFVEDSKLAAELIYKHTLKVGSEQSHQMAFNGQRFQINLLYIQKKFEEALRSLKLSHNHILFIDGIDIRPSSMSYVEFLECVKGLSNAIWSINNDFFSSIKDSKGRLRIVLLIRPDIFNSIGLQNINNKVRDNSILLDWRTTYRSHRQSPIFMMADRLLSCQQQTELKLGEAWDYYFPYDPASVKKEKLPNLTTPTSFIQFLRFSLYRPRDIITMLTILQENFKEQNYTRHAFIEGDFNGHDFIRKLSIYLLGEVKEQILFYYSNADYELFLKFFEYLDGSYTFTYEKYCDAYYKFIQFIIENKKTKPVFCETADEFLQFLYDLNILCYTEKTFDEDNFMRWCFRERNFSNISPKVKTHRRYVIHYGFRRALNLGKLLY